MPNLLSGLEIKEYLAEYSNKDLTDTFDTLTPRG